MKHPVFKFAAITSLLLVTGLGGQLLFNSKPPPEEETEAVLGNARNLMIAYERWKAQAMQNGLDRKLALSLGYSKGLSAKFTQAHGQAILDLVDGVSLSRSPDYPIRMPSTSGSSTTVQAPGIA